MARFYSNENSPLPAVEELRRLGHDVLTVQESGRAGQALSDEAVLAFASVEGRVLLTLNRKHFVRLHRQGSNHAGIVACTFDPDLELARLIDEAASAQGSLTGQLVRVNRPSP
jgi:hypothetical protein